MDSFKFKVKNLVPKYQRIDIFLKEELSHQKIFISRSFIQKNLHHIKINGRICTKANQKIKENDWICYSIESKNYYKYLNPFFVEIKAEINIPILYQDEDLLIVDKPKNLIVHPALSYKNWSLLHYLQDYLSSFKKDFLQNFKSNIDYLTFSKEENLKLSRPGVVHRIDKLCSGILILARHQKSQEKLIEIFKKRKIKKIYLAIVKGIPPKSDSWKDLIGRDPQHRKQFKISPSSINPKIAITSFKRISILKKYPPISLVKINLITGRSHQIRCHFSHKNFPLFGDPLYSKCELDLEKKNPLALLSYKISFIHPMKKHLITIKSSFLKEFFALCQEIKKNNL